MAKRIPARKLTAQMCISVPRKLKAQIRREAKRRGETMSGWITRVAILHIQDNLVARLHNQQKTDPST